MNKLVQTAFAILLAGSVLVGCQTADSPVAPVQQALNQSTDSNPQTMAELKAKVETAKQGFLERIRQIKEKQLSGKKGAAATDNVDEFTDQQTWENGTAFGYYYYGVYNYQDRQYLYFAFAGAENAVEAPTTFVVPMPKNYLQRCDAIWGNANLAYESWSFQGDRNGIWDRSGPYPSPVVLDQQTGITGWRFDVLGGYVQIEGSWDITGLTPERGNYAVVRNNEVENLGNWYVVPADPLYAISGVAYYDLDGSGTQDAGEPGISGVGVSLSNGATTTTGDNGAYSFADLGAGAYTVTVGEWDNRSHTTASSVDLTLDADLTASFGFTGYIVSGSVRQVNQDPHQPTRLGIDGSTITLSNGQSVGTRRGRFIFSDLAPGAYTTTITPPDGYEVVGNAVSEFSITHNDVSLDFQIQLIPANFNLTGVTFYDLNGNGAQDFGEPGIAGISVSLSTGATTTTDANGAYTFGELSDGDYTVAADDFNGRTHTTAASQSVTISGADGSVNFGYSGYSISGVLFFDVNGNGSQDAGELGIGGQSVSLSGGGSTSSAANGYYAFGSLLPGNYTVSVGAISGFNSTTGLSSNVTISTTDATANFGFSLNINWFNSQRVSGVQGSGWWKENINKAIRGQRNGVQISAAALESLRSTLSTFAYPVLNFANLTGAYNALSYNGGNAASKVSLQLTACEYNFANGALVNGNSLATWGLMVWGEYVVANVGAYSNGYLNDVKDLFEGFNGGQLEVHDNLRGH